MLKYVKKIAAVLVALVLLPGFSGVGAKGGLAVASAKSAQVEAPDLTGKSIELTYQYWDLLPDQEGIFERFSEHFKEKTGGDITVNGQFISDSGWEDILKTQVASGSGPDVFHLDLNNASAWKDTVIQPLNSYYTEDFWNQFIPTSIDVWNFDGDYYAVPNSFSVISILYNVDMFEEAGIEVDEDTHWTLEDFEQAMEALYDTFEGKTVSYSDGKDYPYFVVNTRSLMYWFWMFFGQGGQDLASTNNIAQEAYVDSIMKIADYANKGWVNHSADVQPVNAAVAFSTAANVGMLLTGDWTPTGFYRTDKGIGEEAVPLVVNYASMTTPLGTDGKVHSEMYNQGVVMNKNLSGDKAFAAACLIEFMTTTEAWISARGPEVGGLGIPARTEWAELYKTTWFENPIERTAFIWTAENGIITSPDYHLEGIDVYTPIQEVLTMAYDEAKKSDYDHDKVRELVVKKLEEGQKLLNSQFKESGIKSDNPDAKVK